MAILSKGTDFTTGDQVTAANLDALVDSATFAAGAVDDSTTALDSSSPQKIIVKNGGIGTTQLATSSSTTTGVTFEKMQHVAANTVLVNDTNAEGDISAKAVADTQILIGDGTGFTAAALSGDATMTNAVVVDISDDVALGGNPTTTTQSVGNNTTRVATTAFVTTAFDNAIVAPNNRLLIKILPNHFVAETIISPVPSTQSASYDLPSGYQATEVLLYAENDSNGRYNVTVSEGNINSATVTSKGTTGRVTGNQTLNITDVVATDTNYIIVEFTEQQSSQVFYGGSITLVKV